VVACGGQESNDWKGDQETFDLAVGRGASRLSVARCGVRAGRMVLRRVGRPLECGAAFSPALGRCLGDGVAGYGSRECLVVKIVAGAVLFSLDGHAVFL
jgi:hypothetical protein